MSSFFIVIILLLVTFGVCGCGWPGEHGEPGMGDRAPESAFSLSRVWLSAPPDKSTVRGPFQVRVDFSTSHIPLFDSPSSSVSEFTLWLDGDASFTGNITASPRPFYILNLAGLPEGPHIFELTMPIPEEPFATRVLHRISITSIGPLPPPRLPPRPRIPCNQFTVGVRGRAFGNSPLTWCTNETAILVLDMWAGHVCRSAALRTGAMAQKLNQALIHLRDTGMFVLHVPSAGVDGMSPSYPMQRQRMVEAACTDQVAKACPATPHHGASVPRLPSEPSLPVTSGGCDGDEGALGGQIVDMEDMMKQHDSIVIFPQDGLSDNPREIFGYFAIEGIRNVILVGVHADECILKRPYGARALRLAGMNVVLARDYTDALYDPRDPPHVSHGRGTAMVVEHIQEHVCGTVRLSDIEESTSEMEGESSID